MSAHQCHAEGCTTPVPPRMMCCRRHWSMVPRRLQRLLWSAYRPGQERDKRVTVEYLVFQTWCRLAIAEAEGNLAAVKVRAELGKRLRELLAADAPDRHLGDEQLTARCDEALGRR